MDISSPIGLAGLAVGVATVLAVVLRRRRGRMAGGAGAADPALLDALDAVSLAFLAGGPARAVTAALTQLRAAGFVDGWGRPTSGPVGGLDPFDAVVLDACARHRRPTVATLVRDREVRAAASALEGDLERRGLLDAAAARWALRAPQLIVVVAVVAGLLATHTAGGPFAAGSPIVPLVVLVAVAFLLARIVRRVRIAATARARAVLARARTDQAHLDPRMSPSFVTYGPRAAGLAVAVFGAGSVLGVDPSFAAACGVLGSSSAGGSGAGSDSGSMSWLGGDNGCCGSGGGGGCGSGGSDGCGSGGSDGGVSCGSSCGGGGGCGSGS